MICAAVADTKWFTRTGIQVNRSQSAANTHIKRLEEEIGKPCFARIGKTVKLNIDGGLLTPYARRIVKAHGEAVRAVSTVITLTASLIRSDQVRSGQIRSGQVRSDQISGVGTDGIRPFFCWPLFNVIPSSGCVICAKYTFRPQLLHKISTISC